MHADPLAAYAYRWLGGFLPTSAIDAIFGWFWRHLRGLGRMFDSVICANAELAQRLTAGGVRNVETIRRWSVDYFEALHPFSAGGAYVNMMMDEGQERVRASYRENYDRLAQVKATYDPENFFHVNQNIHPAR